ncbi:MAG: hypothetical protein PF690_00310 [Deltaproteobacteria bacterium]|nr:hypothetical protein [Deltaproteobacteria bacterium]
MGYKLKNGLGGRFRSIRWAKGGRYDEQFARLMAESAWRLSRNRIGNYGHPGSGKHRGMDQGRFLVKCAPQYAAYPEYF